MRRRLFSVCSAGSLLVCGLMIALWVRSYRTNDSLTRTRANIFDVTTPGPRVGIVVERVTEWNITSLRSADGIICLSWTSARGDPDRGGDRPTNWQPDPRTHLRGDVLYEASPVERNGIFAEPNHTVAARLGFDSADWAWSETDRAAGIPIWLIVVLTAAVPTMRGIAHVRRRLRQRLGATTCLECGYDLRASFDRCPECGAELRRSKP